MDGKQRYTERAMRVLTWAQEEARSRGAQAMDTEHILLGLLRERGSVALLVLEALGITPARVKEEIEQLSDKKDPVASIEAVTSSAKKVLSSSGRSKQPWPFIYRYRAYLAWAYSRGRRACKSNTLRYGGRLRKDQGRDCETGRRTGSGTSARD